MAELKIAVIKGDGIGPEIINEAEQVLHAIGKKFNHKFIFTDVLMGGEAIDKTGVPLPDETVKICLESQAVLLGAIGGEKWDNLPGHLRPEAGLLGIRKALGLYANLRPAVINRCLAHSSSLKSELIEYVNIIVVRELCGGIYFGEKKRGEDSNGTYALDTEKYYDFEIDRIAETAFEIAMKRGKKLCSVDKANVLESSRFWRERVTNISKNYPDVTLSHMYIDNAAMQLIRHPSQFDVIVTSNMFGDILSDEASMLCGSIGMLPSASLRRDKFGLYEPIHGSAPDIAGQNLANPIAAILSCAMMLRYTFNLDKEASTIEKAVNLVLEHGYRSADIAKKSECISGTAEMGNVIRKYVEVVV